MYALVAHRIEKQVSRAHGAFRCGDRPTDVGVAASVWRVSFAGI
jgi:hypothetical protein